MAWRHPWRWGLVGVMLLGFIILGLLGALMTPSPNRRLAVERDHPPSDMGKAPSPPQRRLIRSVPAANVYAYENAAGETVEEIENRQGRLINRRFW
jgi:hypothetical protein